MIQATPAKYDSFSNGTEGAAQGAGRVTVAHYTADEVIRQFLALYHCLDFKAELADIGIGRLQFVRRYKALREFKALSIALWRLALQKSFPLDAESFFNEFKDGIADLAGTGKAAERFAHRIDIYSTLLSSKKDSDFLPVAEHISEVLSLHADDLRHLRLKLSLVIRHLYVLIFDRLV